MRRKTRAASPAAGFTVIEMVVALVVMIQLILAVLLLFDFSNKLARVQGNVADMQQSLRVSQYDTVRLIRMAGRGPLPLTPMTATGANTLANYTLNGLALSVRDNAVAGAQIAGNNSPTVVTGSDVLIVRGVISNPIYQVPTSASINLGVNGLGTGSIFIPASAPSAATGVNGIPQHLDALVTAIRGDASTGNQTIPEPLLLVSPIDDTVFAVVELDPSHSDASNPTNGVTVAFRYSSATGGVRPATYTSTFDPGGVFPASMTSVAAVGILEEYRIYVRSFSNNPPAGSASAADKAAALNPKLSRARVFPGTDDPYGPGTAAGYVATNAASYSLDVADDVIDLQVALGFDSELPGTSGAPQSINAGTATSLVETNDDKDDWLFNSTADNPTTNLATWNNAVPYYVRLSTLVRTDRPDPKYTAPLVVKIEDNSYATSPFNSGKNLLFRRRLLQTIVDLRNLG